MARRLRLQFAGAMYHVINRGNYRRDVFDGTGVAKAFELALDEACRRYPGKPGLHAYVVMRNHFHLALETAEPNLVDGMHWLQSTFATRFNRFRSESGHLFQGRYQALLVEDMTALARVVNYIHLNPVRAKIVPNTQVAAFRRSSLSRLARQQRPEWLVADWLEQLGHTDTPQGWRQYVLSLIELAAESNTQGQHQEFCRGWAIGTQGWRQAVAKDHARLSLGCGVAANELRDFKHARWAEALERVLKEAGKSPEMARGDAKGAKWKRIAAGRLRMEVGASHHWIAEALSMGSSNSVRSYLSRDRREG